MRQCVPRTVAAGEDGTAEPGEPGAAAGAAALGVRGRGTPPPRAPLGCRDRESSTPAPEPRPSPNLLLKMEAKLFGGHVVIISTKPSNPAVQRPEMIVVVSRSPRRHIREYPLRRCL